MLLNNLFHSHYFYIILLVFSVSGMAIFDWRYSLVFFKNAKASLAAILLSMLILIIFDIAGIYLNIFDTNQNYVSGFYILNPNLPIEEFIFLFLLGYFTLNIYNFVKTRKKDV